ncbi:MAG TPA: aldehyde-activating protein [Hyphomonadaceae bacterium]|nr:aldehyde-activating protein [Hyphomonadaceae bacterium]
MSHWLLPWTASCLCGRVKMRVTEAPAVATACHCKACQKLSSGPYSLTLLLPAAGFEVIEGATEIGGLHSPDVRHHYCPHCKSWVYTTATALAGFVNFRATMLEDASWVMPFVDMQIADKLPGVVSGASRSYPGFPPPEDYGSLMEAFAKEGARPG